MSKKPFLSRINLWTLGAALFAAAVLMYCGGGVPLTAPTGAELSITANPTTIPVVDGVSTITVTGFKGADDGGGPLSNGTQIFFTTNVGLIDERVEMRDGLAKAYLQSAGRAGSAIVEARSGVGITATLANPVLIGNAGSVNITVTANPATVTEPDYTSDIVATVFDNDNNRLPDMPLIFSTSAGSLASQGSILTTNSNGQAFDRLTLEDESSATVTVSSGAATGSVTIGRGAVVTPIVTSLSPSIADRGQTLNVTIAGLNFQPGAQVSFGEGVAVNNVEFVNSTTLVVTITVDGSATTGTRTVTVTNPDGGSGSLSGVFRVGRVPIVTGVNPAAVSTNTTVNVDVFGTNFQPGAFVFFSGTGITVNSTTFISSTQITVNITVAPAAPAGQRDITVTNPDGGTGTLFGRFTVN